ncbi:uncharacterized protein AMSG_07342 [Thecamonas trahens ATCC 50062]|uniref:ENTH domain-containing protein n=1 Tax=Thecamonas trahens ATCC 50062 TaxID=461836 RepID=A0A0L0DJ20_THETB|nr:hypothetical protein AMSG_07342 [Thecamonas trahens ATCC 50062]KNC51328.1 hypothetical protein AMSG_07342 [Thecamonas trahens ATCC 50062]|eukprot:XP_013756248.1 hypothetical protein AMSG_07342 [Thecamonas trahens ATCC 50062]
MAVAWLKDKASVLKATGNELEKAVVKATSHLEVAPKAKHVRRLILTTYDSPQEAVFAMRHLLERLQSKDWVVVLKAITVFHRLFREGDDLAIDKVAPHPEVFSVLGSFIDRSDVRAMGQSTFVQNYANYLVEKLAAYSALKCQLEKPPLPGDRQTGTSIIKGMKVRRLLKVVPRLQRQLNMLFTCDPDARMLDNGATVFAFTLLIKDAFKLFHLVNDAILIIIDAFFDMKQDDALRSITLYQEYVLESDLIRDLMRKANKIPGLDLNMPSLKPASTGLLSALEEYVNAGNFDHAEAEVRDVSELLADSMPHDLVVGGSSAPAPQSAAPKSAPLISLGNDESAAHLDPLGTPGKTAAAAAPSAAAATAFDPFGSVPFEKLLAQQHSSGASTPTPTPTSAPATGAPLLDMGGQAYARKQSQINELLQQTSKPAPAPGVFGGAPPIWAAPAGQLAAGPPPAAAAAPALAAPLVPVTSSSKPTGPLDKQGTAKQSSNNPFDFGDLLEAFPQ